MTGFHVPARWPPPADVPAAERLVAALAEPLALAKRRDAEAVRAMLLCLGGNSRFLSDLALRETTLLSAFLRHGPARALRAALDRLRTLHPQSPRREIAAGLRRAKREVALVSALADLGGIWSLDEVTGALSLLAEAALRVAVAHLLLVARQSGQIALPDPSRPERGSGFIVLGMGKLGARELNYSSDIDLVLIFDPEPQGEREDVSRAFSRIATGLVSLMEARDADGYVFRTDLRLRPDPGATPPAISLPAALTYYESYGRTWERAAMIKARPVAGDIEAGERFLQGIAPFIWRRHLDFAAIDDIHAMKARIDRNKPAPAAGFDAAGFGAAGADPVSALLGHDLKLGRGGIREIEFIAQALLLVRAGRNPELRDPTTLGALGRLAAAGHLKPERAASLARTYTRLRMLEHRLQMQDDQQTHSLPTDRERFRRFALFAGAGTNTESGSGADSDAGIALANSLLPELRRTRARFDAVLRAPLAPGGGRGAGATGDEEEFDPDAPDIAQQLLALGYDDPKRVRDILRGWQTDDYRALRQQRARALLAALVPALLRSFAAEPDPVGVLLRFDALLAKQNAGVQFLSLLQRSPSLLQRIAVILGASPTLSAHLAAVPGALDGLLEPEPDSTAGRAVLRNLDALMRGAADVEEAIRIARSLVRGEEFRIAVAELDTTLGLEAAAAARTALADRAITSMLRVVVADHRRRYGNVPGGGMAVVALGRCGSGEMMAGSDLDLMLVYDHPEDVQNSVPAGPGGRTTAPAQYFTRLAHALIAALSAPGLEGPLFALDMRLRPSGSKGPVAVSLAAFRRYHARESWSWERMALTRARVVAGPPALRKRLRVALAEALRSAGPTLHADAAAMRARIARDLPPRGLWDVKLRPGGLMEVEFIAQVLQLAAADPRCRHPSARIAFGRLRRAGLLEAADARALLEADQFWRTLQSRFRLLIGNTPPASLPGPLPPAAMGALLAGWPEIDPVQDGLEALSGRCEQVAGTVRMLFERLVAPLPSAARPNTPPAPGRNQDHAR